MNLCESQVGRHAESRCFSESAGITRVKGQPALESGHFRAVDKRPKTANKKPRRLGRGSRRTIGAALRLIRARPVLHLKEREVDKWKNNDAVEVPSFYYDPEREGGSG